MDDSYQNSFPPDSLTEIRWGVEDKCIEENIPFVKSRLVKTARTKGEKLGQGVYGTCYLLRQQ